MSNDIMCNYSSNEFSVVGDACVINPSDMPGWLITYLNQLIDSKIAGLKGYVINTTNITEYYNNVIGDITTIINDLSTGAIDIHTTINNINTNILRALDELEIAKNDYDSYAIKKLTDYESFVAAVTTLNASISNNDASIKNLLLTYATKTEALAYISSSISAALNGGLIGSKIASVETAMATQYGAMAQRVRTMDANYTDAITGLQAKAEVYEATVAIVGKDTDGPEVSSLIGKGVSLESYITDPTTQARFGGTKGLGGVIKTISNDAGKRVIDAYSKYSTITVGGTEYVNGFGIFGNYDDTAGGSSTFWVAADNFKMYDPNTLQDTDLDLMNLYDDALGTTVKVVKGIKNDKAIKIPFQVTGGSVYIDYSSVSGTPTHSTGTTTPTTPLKDVDWPANGSTWTNTSVIPNIVYTFTDGVWYTVSTKTQFTSMAFFRSSVTPTAASGGSFTNPLPTKATISGVEVATAWSDGIPVESDGKPCYFTTRVFVSTGDENTWSTPRLLSNTTDISYIYSTEAAYSPIDTTVGPIAGANSKWTATGSTSSIWGAVSTMKNNKWSSWTIFKIKGESGNDSSNFYIANSNVVFNASKSGTITPTGGITLNTASSNITGTISYKWSKDDTVITGATKSSYLIPTSDYTSSSSHTYKCTVSGTINGVSKTLSDSITIPKLIDGTDSGTLSLGNENITFTCPVSTGYTGIVFTSGACSTLAWIGSTSLTYTTAAIPIANTYTLSVTLGTGVTLTAASISTAGVVNYPSAMTAEVAYVDVTATLYNAAGAIHSTITKRITYSLSRTGSIGNPGSRGATVTTLTIATELSKYTTYNADFAKLVDELKIKYDTIIVTSTHATDNGTSTYRRTATKGTSWENFSLYVGGNVLVTGSIDVSKVKAGANTQNAGYYFGLGGGNPGTSQNAAVVGLTSNVAVGVLGANSSTSGTGVHGSAAGGSGVWGEAISGTGVTGKSTSGVHGVYGKTSSTLGTSSGVYGISDYGVGVAGVGSNTTNGHGIRGASGMTVNGKKGSGLVGAANGYAFYVDPDSLGYGSFTGAHDGLLSKSEIFTEGDIVVDGSIIYKAGTSDTISELKLSSMVNQKEVVGVLVRNNGRLESYVPTALYMLGLTANDIEEDYVIFNALGEGQVNVCGLGGNLEAGDLITTSAMVGKGMKQHDDIIRNYTLGKCREEVIFDYPEQVKQVACIYMCG